MKYLNFTSIYNLPGLLLLILMFQPAYAEDYSGNISEEYLRSQFTFEAGDKLKFTECKKQSYPTCTYIWGAAHKKDEARLKYGLAPEGNKLMIVYAQARSKKDFERVLATYKDAVKVDGLAAEAVWSKKRGQLSMITDSNLVVHVNVRDKGTSDRKEKSISIANDLLKKL
jgi:hypothetical protein